MVANEEGAARKRRPIDTPTKECEEHDTPQFLASWGAHLIARRSELEKVPCVCETFGKCWSCRELAEIRAALHSLRAVEKMRAA